VRVLLAEERIGSSAASLRSMSLYGGEISELSRTVT
jgi:hypothetical protein